MRKEVCWFAERMESRLSENDHKPGWQDSREDREFLLKRLEANYHKLWAAEQCYGSAFDPENVVKKAADIANFAMMLADNARRDLERQAKEAPNGH
ncbi:hypothetical protein [Paenibacillus humicus]|uniref:hypothetical protein n=1 Tax=Paenibacillus humicus TaxID=412861 RepID=UPI000FDB10E1|nr:hypothetical protein [Paenibacillus humicus]